MPRVGHRRAGAQREAATVVEVACAARSSHSGLLPADARRRCHVALRGAAISAARIEPIAVRLSY
ncbi:MAG: hypothetical protein M3O34_13415 [Chloroflexota bacterium]|nr:hypothetical protein [Chloroflexota bacterium]